jgi:hypothetical protein
MKCTYTSKNGQLQFEFDANGPKDLFLQRSIVEMHDEEVCGCCKGPHIRCEVRTTKEGHTYYEMRCQNRLCGARLEFGQNKDMRNLFVKRSTYPDTNGWYVYQGEEQGQDEASQNGSSGPKTPTPTRTRQDSTSDTPIAPPPPADVHLRVLNSLAAASDADNADAWLAWAAKSPHRTQGQKAEQEAAHRKALERIRTAKAKSVAGRD